MIHCDEPEMHHLFVNKWNSVTTPLKVVLPVNPFPPLFSIIIWYYHIVIYLVQIYFPLTAVQSFSLSKSQMTDSLEFWDTRRLVIKMPSYPWHSCLHFLQNIRQAVSRIWAHVFRLQICYWYEIAISSSHNGSCKLFCPFLEFRNHAKAIKLSRDCFAWRKSWIIFNIQTLM